MSHPFIPVPNVASLEAFYAVNGIVAENVYHFRKDSPFSGTELQDLRAKFLTWHGANFVIYKSNGCFLTRVRTKALDSDGAPMEDYTLPVQQQGNVNQVPLPQNVTFCIKISTGLGGRSYRGRHYIVGMCAGLLDTNPNYVQAAYVSSWVSALNALLSTMASNGYTWGVVSYRHLKAWRTEGVFTPATGCVAVDRAVDSQRRRLTGRGI